jgi:glycosyltransferase involved in cell wall biosynthesis
LSGPKLRILHTEASTGWGGQEIRILEEAAGLIARGYDVRVAAPETAPILQAAIKRGIPVHPLTIDRRRPSSVVAFAKLVRTVRPDVVATHSSSDSWIASIATLFFGPRSQPAIVRVRHLSTPVAGGALNRWLYGRIPERVVTTGEAIRTLLIETLKLKPRHVISVPTGTDTARFQPGDRKAARAALGLPAESPLIGIVATLRSWKGHRYLIRAMKDTRLSGAQLVIVGDGPYGDHLRNAEAVGMTNIMFVGQQEHVARWMHAFDTFVLPSTGNEGVPQALVQAMACGLPVITTAVGAIPEAVQGGETGLIVPTENSEALADAIHQLLTDPALARRLADAGHRHVRERFSASAMLDAMEKVYREACGK